MTAHRTDSGWDSSQAMPAFLANLIGERVGDAATKADRCEVRPALRTEVSVSWRLLLTARTLHVRPPLNRPVAKVGRDYPSKVSAVKPALTVCWRYVKWPLGIDT